MRRHVPVEHTTQQPFATAASELKIRRQTPGISDHPMIEDIKRKTFTGSLRLSEAQLTRDDAVQTFVATCKELAPLMRFLAKAVGAPW